MRRGVGGVQMYGLYPAHSEAGVHVPLVPTPVIVQVGP